MKDNLEMEQADVFINSAYDEINRLKDGIEQGKYSADELDQIITRIGELNEDYKPEQTAKVFCITRLNDYSQSTKG